MTEHVKLAHSFEARTTEDFTVEGQGTVAFYIDGERVEFNMLREVVRVEWIAANPDLHVVYLPLLVHGDDAVKGPREVLDRHDRCRRP